MDGVVRTAANRWEADGAVATTVERPDRKVLLRLPPDRPRAWHVLAAAVAAETTAPLLVHVESASDVGAPCSRERDPDAPSGSAPVANAPADRAPADGSADDLRTRAAGASDPDAAGPADTATHVLVPLGFTATRSEQYWRIPVVRPRRTITTGRHVLRPVTELDPARVAELDNAIREDIPGTEHWHGTTADLLASLDDDELDPDLYLVAENTGTGEYDGLIRVWRRAPTPRLGCLGVRRPWRRTRLAAMLATTIAARLDDQGFAHVTTETDPRNRDSHGMAQRLGGVPTRRLTEWERPAR